MKTRISVVLISLWIAGNAQAEGSFGAKAGTLGLGLEGTWQLSPRWGIRGGLNQFDYSFDDDLDGVTYDGDLELSSIAILGDYRPWSAGFRLTGGAVFNNNEISAVADPAPSYDIGDNTYTLEEVGVLSAAGDFDSIAPYLGLGYDFGMSPNLRLILDLGVLFQGDADVRIDSTGGTLSDDPGLRADLDAEEDSFRDDLDGFDLYPVLSIGVSYAFK